MKSSNRFLLLVWIVSGLLGGVASGLLLQSLPFLSPKSYRSFPHRFSSMRLSQFFTFAG